MSYNIKLDLKGKVVEGKAVPIFNRIMKKELLTVLTQLETDVANKTPVGVTGEARAGVDYRVEGKIKGRVYTKGPAKRYVEVLEKGREKGGKFPPPDAIELWLRRTGKGKTFVKIIQDKYKLSPEQALKRAVFLKSRAIARQGTRPVKMYHKTYLKRRTWVKRRFDIAAAKFVRSA